MTSAQHRGCKVDGCGRSHRSRGYCRMHYKRWQNGTDLNAPPRVVEVVHRESCTVENCNNKHQARGFCHVHYARWNRTGSPMGKGPLPRSEVVRLRRLVGVPDDGPTPEMCKEWEYAEGVAA